MRREHDRLSLYDLTASMAFLILALAEILWIDLLHPGVVAHNCQSYHCLFSLKTVSSAATKGTAHHSSVSQLLAYQVELQEAELDVMGSDSHNSPSAGAWTCAEPLVRVDNLLMGCV